jgi:hypothetical protein
MLVPLRLHRIESDLDLLQNPRRVVLRPDIHDTIVAELASVGRAWQPVIRNVPVIVMEIEGEYEIEVCAPDLTGEEE